MPFANSQSLIALLRHTLMQNTSLTDLVGGRIYGAHVHTPDSITVVYPLVIIELEGGSVGTSSSYQQQIIFLYGYSRESIGQAIEIYDAAHASLHHQLLKRAGNPVAGYAMETLRPEQGWNEQVQSHFVRGMYVLRATTGN